MTQNICYSFDIRINYSVKLFNWNLPYLVVSVNGTRIVHCTRNQQIIKKNLKNLKFFKKRRGNVVNKNSPMISGTPFFSITALASSSTLVLEL